MKSRVIGTVLFGFGVLALVFAGGLAFVVAPTAKQLPYDMELTQSVAEAPNARFMQITNGQVVVNSGTLRSTVTVQPDSGSTAKLEGDLDGSALVWVAGQQVQRTDTGDLISAYSTSLAVDRKTAAAQAWKGQWLDTGSDRQPVKYDGQIYKFPFGTTKDGAYKIFDRDILESRPAQFVKTEEIQGLETYQFTQTIQNETQDVPKDRLAVALSSLLPGATDGKIQYSNTRTVWVEPNTGQFIRVQEQQKKQLVSTDNRSVDVLDATFAYTDETVTKAAATAKDNIFLLNIVSLWGPLGLALLGLILAAAGGLLVVRGRVKPATVGVPAQWTGSPRHAANTEATQASASADKA
ncbi:DUF3068 domain-containing protein [Actinoplanes sp. NEAU-A12]|uniref:DUF3068 domain-containing protein n=1 Tax=Actinoplanes sandaracinus TaxID=3045177 RepID=A0ABT6WS91_9ACTN|nr:DUF3068 domain-containing protein [Actinoplanes sandaracinus]MDI6102608.1 DUF3068 domain-containing protein [Actinoplanes sandaracinus]